METVAVLVPSIAAKEVVVGFMAQVLQFFLDDGDNTENNICRKIQKNK